MSAPKRTRSPTSLPLSTAAQLTKKIRHSRAVAIHVASCSALAPLTDLDASASVKDGLTTTASAPVACQRNRPPTISRPCGKQSRPCRPDPLKQACSTADGNAAELGKDAEQSGRPIARGAP